VQQAVGGCVDTHRGGAVEECVEQVGQVDGVIHQSASSGQLLVDEPGPAARRELAVVGAGDRLDLAEAAAIVSGGERRERG
jgi:hypothetical protein